MNNVGHISKKEIAEVKEHLNSGGSYLNESANYQFVLRKDGIMLRFDNDGYTFYTNIDKFCRAIIRTTRRGY
jgi:hypothetical protein